MAVSKIHRMTKLQSKIEELIALDRQFSATEARAKGVSSSLLAYYCHIGKLERVARGIYAPAHAPLSTYHELEQLKLKNCDFVLCLLSALHVHELTTQSPTAFWLALAQGVRLPQMGTWQPECIRLSKEPFSYGVEEHVLGGVSVKVYSAAKTVADCFKFRHKIGIDVAIEALRDGYQRRCFSISELMQAAQVNRVARIITPYVESLIS